MDAKSIKAKAFFMAIFNFFKAYYAKKILIFCIVCFSTFYGCQLPLANHFRDKIFPQETTEKIALSPILFPTYAVLSVFDISIINPVRGCENVPQAIQSIWQWQNDRPWLGNFALIPFKVIAIPPAAIGTAIFSEQFIYNKSSSGQGKN